jgi:hypothetical protein
LETKVVELEDKITTGTAETHRMLAMLLAKQQGGDLKKYMKYHNKNANIDK